MNSRPINKPVIWPTKWQQKKQSLDYQKTRGKELAGTPSRWLLSTWP